MVFLAVLNDNGICKGVKQTKGFINDKHHVEIEDMNEDFLYRKYVNGKWSDEKFPPKSNNDPEPTTDEKLDKLQSDNTNLMISITDLYSEIQSLKGSNK